MSDIQTIESNTALQTVAKVEIDTQIATAKQYPRNIEKVMANAITTIKMSREVAESCSYALPRKQKNEDGKFETVFITGPSKRLAEIVSQFWGNLKLGKRVLGIDGNFIMAEGICFDLENNMSFNTVVKRRITNKDGYKFSDDMIMVTGAAAASIALRNAVFEIIPKIFIEQLQKIARDFLDQEMGPSLDKALDKLFAALKKYGIEECHVLNIFNYANKADITREDYHTLMGIGVAIKDGQIKPESIISDEPIPGEDEGLTKSDQILSKINKAREKK